MNDKPDGLWDLDRCSAGAFPFQSHHLIPKAHLPKKDICVWLAQNYTANADWRLESSTYYDTDAAENGMPLPFVSTTYQWKHTSSEKKKDELCNQIMFLTKRQLHQGSHTYEVYLKDGDEEPALHEDEQVGYLGAVDELLNVVHGQTLSHVQVCEECKKKAGKPTVVRPLPRVVQAVHQVSNLIGQMIDKRTIFVSERAAHYPGDAAFSAQTTGK